MGIFTEYSAVKTLNSIRSKKFYTILKLALSVIEVYFVDIEIAFKLEHSYYL